jgi:hypothetical protein
LAKVWASSAFSCCSLAAGHLLAAFGNAFKQLWKLAGGIPSIGSPQTNIATIRG